MIVVPLPNAVVIPMPDDLARRLEDEPAKLYQMYAPALMGIISRIVKSEVTAEDVLQITFVKIMSSIDGYDPLRSRLFTWMAEIARHAAIDRLGIKHLASNLQPSEKEILHLIYFEGYTHSETAEKLDIPLGTVKAKLRLAISSLRKQV